MNKFTDTNISPNAPRWRRTLAVAWRWLIEPSPSVVALEQRYQARLLMAMLLVLLIIGLLSLILSFLGIYSGLDESQATVSLFRWITFGAVLLLAVEHGLSRTIHFQLAALLAVGTVLGSIFAVVIISPGVLQYVFFLVLGGLVGSLFLSTRATAMVFIVTFVGALLLPSFAPGYPSSNNIYALFFIMSIGALVVMAASLRQRYLEQIDWQTQQLLESEARLRELSVRDPLTGLFNRRHLDELLPIELARAKRAKLPLTIFMLDIDHFKNVNDRHGHQMGDAILQAVADALKKNVRIGDSIFRHGGEEFLVILPGMRNGDAHIRAESLRTKVASQIVAGTDGPVSVTISIGVSIYPETGMTSHELISLADQALYRAKQNGRNRVEYAGS